MGLRDFSDDPVVVDQALRLSRACLRDQVRRNRDALDRYDARLADADVEAMSEVELDDPRGPLLLGVGVLADARHDRPLVVVQRDRVEQELPEGEPIPVSEVSEVGSFLAEVTAGGPQRFAEVVVIAVSEPRGHFAAGGGVSCLGRRGTLGALVTSHRGRDAILTAGHVAAQGATARDEQGHSGQVVFSADPSTSPGRTVSADVAVVEARDWEPATVRIGGTARAKGRDELAVHGRVSGPARADVAAFCTYFNWPGVAGAWADVYLTDAGISQPGDSGAAACLAGTDLLVGHVVGGSGSVMSYVQDVETQLRAAHATLR